MIFYEYHLGASIPGAAAPNTTSVGSSSANKKGYAVSIFVCSDVGSFASASAAIKRYDKLANVM